jgi:hypothetical protein
MDENSIEWCPTQAGTFPAYKPEWFNEESGKWQAIEVRRSERGIPYPLYCGGIAMTIGLCGHAQAQAVAWSFAAQAMAEGKEIQVRVQPYEVAYDIKARKKDLEIGDKK